MNRNRLSIQNQLLSRALSTACLTAALDTLSAGITNIRNTFFERSDTI